MQIDDGRVALRITSRHDEVRGYDHVPAARNKPQPSVTWNLLYRTAEVVEASLAHGRLMPGHKRLLLRYLVERGVRVLVFSRGDGHGFPGVKCNAAGEYELDLVALRLSPKWRKFMRQKEDGATE